MEHLQPKWCAYRRRWQHGCAGRISSHPRLCTARASAGVSIYIDCARGPSSERTDTEHVGEAHSAWTSEVIQISTQDTTRGPNAPSPVDSQSQAGRRRQTAPQSSRVCEYDEVRLRRDSVSFLWVSSRETEGEGYGH